MLLDTLKSLFLRDLIKLKDEILAYKSEQAIWKTADGISNSAGNLCLHLVGNLNHFIGATLGETGYIRNRPIEFSTKDVPRNELVNMVDDTIQMVENTLDKITDERLKEDFPILVFENKTSTEYFLVHLTTHLAYHVGQINYLRRLLDK